MGIIWNPNRPPSGATADNSGAFICSRDIIGHDLGRDQNLQALVRAPMEGK